MDTRDPKATAEADAARGAAPSAPPAPKQPAPPAPPAPPRKATAREDDPLTAVREDLQHKGQFKVTEADGRRIVLEPLDADAAAVAATAAKVIGREITAELVLAEVDEAADQARRDGIERQRARTKEYEDQRAAVAPPKTPAGVPQNVVQDAHGREREVEDVAGRKVKGSPLNDPDN